MTYPSPRRPPLRNCVICGTNPRRTFSRSYQCRECLAGAPALQKLHDRRHAGVKPQPSNEIPF